MFRNPLINNAKKLSSTILRKKVGASPLYNLQQCQGKLTFMPPPLKEEDLQEVQKLLDEERKYGSSDLSHVTKEYIESSPVLNKAFKKLQAKYDRGLEQGWKFLIDDSADTLDYSQGDIVYAISGSHYRKIKKGEKLKERALQRIKLAMEALEKKGTEGDIPIPPPRPPRIVTFEEMAAAANSNQENIELLYAVAGRNPPQPLHEILERKRREKQLAKSLKTNS